MQASKTQALRDMGFTVWVKREADSQSLPGSATAAEASANRPAGQAVPPVDAPPQLESHPDHAGFADWAGLERAVAGCTRCPLAKTRRQTVFGVGARDARWLLVGEGPGAEEDRRGEPFVGRAGKLLDAMLAALHLDRDQVFITNIVKCRPPGNRDPAPEEAGACRDYLAQQIEWIAPELILALGRLAAQQLTGGQAPLGRMRGRVHAGPNGVPIVVTYHPAYLLRTPAAKRKVWEDLKLALATASPLAS